MTQRSPKQQQPLQQQQQLRTATPLIMLLLILTACMPLTDSEPPTPPTPPTPPPPTVTIVELAIWPDSATVMIGQSIQFCALARLSDNPTLWVALPSQIPAPTICVLAAQTRNQPDTD